MKLLKELELEFESPLWNLNPELAVVDTILENYPVIYEIVSNEIRGAEKANKVGRQDRPAVEQIVRAAIYKELKGLSYRELEYAQHDSRICSIFIKLGHRTPFSFEVFQKYISRISGESLQKVLVEINRIAMEEGLEDGKKIRTDSTIVETNIHYPTNNALIWDSVKEINRIFKNLEKIGSSLKARSYKKQVKKNYYKINNTKSKEKRKEIFKSQLKLFKSSINQAEKLTAELSLGKCIDLKEWSILESLKNFLPTALRIYDISYRHEILGTRVPNEEKIFSIYEPHTDIIVKGSREVQFGHKVNITTGASNLILDCEILEGNPNDSTLYSGVLERLESNYGVTPRDMVTDGGYASNANSLLARKNGIVNIVFNKVVGSLKNIATSLNMETRLKKWRSGIEAVISNFKRGFNIFRCEWKTKERYDAKVLWSAIAYNIRVMTKRLLTKMQPQTQ